MFEPLGERRAASNPPCGARYRASASIHAYSYDANGNVASIADGTTGNGGNRSIDATSRRLSQLTRPDNSVAYTLAYDAFGNVTGKGAGQDSYAFDAANRMTGVAGKESYSYDGYGRRVKITRLADNKLDYPIYTMGGQLLSDEDQRSNKSTDYIDLNGSLVAKRSTPIGTNTWTTTYEHTDALHSPVAETDSAGNATRIERYTQSWPRLSVQPSPFR
jgi:YD repeat-containing protein